MSSTTPLSGLVVIEIGQSIAAPYAGMILGELGAEVIKGREPAHRRCRARLGAALRRGCRDLLSRGQPRQARHHDRSRRSGRSRKIEEADPRPRRRAAPQSQIRRARPLRSVGGNCYRPEAEPRLLQSRRVRRGRAAARAARLRPADAGLWRADEPDGRGWAAAGAGRRVDRRSRHRDVVGDRHSRGPGRAAAHRSRRGDRHLALRNGARLDDDPDRGLSRQWRDPDAAGIGGRHDRALSGLCRGRWIHHGGGRQRQSVSPSVRRDRPARSRRRPALSHQQGPGGPSPQPDPDPRKYFCRPADRELGGPARCRRDSQRPDADCRPGGRPMRRRPRSA